MNKAISRLLKEAGSGMKRYTDFISINSDRILVVADIHGKLLDPYFLETSIDIAQAWGIKEIVVAGDLFDMSMFSRFGRDTNSPTFRDEIESVEKIIQAFSIAFDKIYLLSGNHDARIILKLEGEFSNTMLGKLITDNKKVIISNYSSCDINSTYKVLHPASYRQVPGSVARDMCSRFLRSVIASHGHGTSMSRDRSGKFYAIDVGGTVDRDKVGYIHHRITPHPKWTRSFVIIADNKPYIIDEDSDFKFWREAGKYFNARGKK